MQGAARNARSRCPRNSTAGDIPKQTSQALRGRKPNVTTTTNGKPYATARVVSLAK
jgi:hypothetical protein